MKYITTLLLLLFVCWLGLIIRNHFFIKKIKALVGKEITLTTTSLGKKQFRVTRDECSPMNNDWDYIWWSVIAEARITFCLVGGNPSDLFIFTFRSFYSWKRNMRNMTQMFDELSLPR